MGVNLTVPEDVTRDVTRFLLRLLNPLAEGADVLSDLIRRQKKVTATTLHRTEELAAEREATLSSVPLKFLGPTLEKASMEEEGSPMTELWAKLIVAAATEYHPRLAKFADILGRLGPKEAELLRWLWSNSPPEHFSTMAAFVRAYAPEAEPVTQTALKLVGVGQVGNFVESSAPGRYIPIPGVPNPPSDDVGDSVRRWELLRMEGLVRIYPSKMPVEHDGGKRGWYPQLWTELTPFGFDFVETLEKGRGRSANGEAQGSSE